MNKKDKCFIIDDYFLGKSVSIEELVDAIKDINQKKSYITKWGLCEEVTALVLKNLEEMKTSLKDCLHARIDEL